MKEASACINYPVLHHQAEWMALFSKMLQYDNPIITTFAASGGSGASSGDGPGGCVERMQAAVLEGLLLYADKYEEEFNPHLPPFTQIVWTLLLRVGDRPNADALAFAGIGFLASVAKKQMHAQLFK